ncbi:hypothetical protein TrRE_jg446, partial [Triparma retinervis]
MTDLALLAEAHRLIGKFIEQARGSNGPPSQLGTQIDPSQSAEAGELRANLPLGTDTVVSEALCNPVGEEMLEDEKEAKIRRASLMEKNFVDKDNVSGRTRV